MPPLKPKQRVPVPRANRALLHVLRKCGDRFAHVLGSDRKAPDVVERRIVRLPHHNVDGVLSGRQQRYVVFKEPLRHLRDREGVGQADKRFDLAQFLHLHAAGQLAVAVGAVDCEPELFA